MPDIERIDTPFRAPPFHETLAYVNGLYADDRDEVGRPYIFRIIRMLALTSDPRVQTAVALHRVRKRFGVSDAKLLDRGYCQQTVDDVRSLTRREGETHRTCVQRIAREGSPSAICAKRLQILDVMETSKLLPTSSSNDERYQALMLAETWLAAELMLAGKDGRSRT